MTKFPFEKRGHQIEAGDVLDTPSGPFEVARVMPLGGGGLLLANPRGVRALQLDARARVDVIDQFEVTT